MTPLKIIKDKCKQHWNKPLIGPIEVQAMLEFIYSHACKAEKEHEKLQDWLNCLKECGVDNWEGYDDAIKAFEESNGS